MKLQNPIVVLFAILLMLIPLNLNAAGKDNETSDLDSQFTKYKNGIQFYIVNGVSVSYKKIISKKSALRFHLDLSGSFSDIDYESNNNHESEVDTTFEHSERDDKTNYHYIDLTFEFLNTLMQKKFIRLYYGGGPYIGYSRSKSVEHGTYEDDYEDYGYYDSEYTRIDFSFGVTGTIGLECPVANRVSIFAENQLLVYHKWEKYNSKYKRVYFVDDYSISNREYNTNSWILRFYSVTIGVSVYF